MKHPRLANWLVFKRCETGEYEVADCLNDEEYIMGCDLARFARRLDGRTDPHTAAAPRPEAADDMLAALDAHGLLRRGRTLSKSPGSISYTVWVPRSSPRQRVAAYLLHRVCRAVWLPLLVGGVCLFWHAPPPLDGAHLLPGSLLGMAAGIVLHEFAHAWAGLSYGGRVFELGVMVHSLLPGAYVLLELSRVERRAHRLHIHAAGVEMNALLTGLFLLLARAVPGAGGLWLCAAVSNGVLAALNLTCIGGLDGAAMLSELLGTDDAVGRAKVVVRSRTARRALLQSGASGRVTVAVCYLLVAAQVALPILYCVGAVEVVAWLL